VVFAKEETTSRSKQLRDDLGPTLNIGQPTECSYAGEYQVKALGTERVDSAVHFTLDVRHIRRALVSKQSRSLHRRGREIKAGYAARTEA
jgi:hypothetical protein